MNASTQRLPAYLHALLITKITKKKHKHQNLTLNGLTKEESSKGLNLAKITSYSEIKNKKLNMRF